MIFSGGWRKQFIGGLWKGGLGQFSGLRGVKRGGLSKTKRGGVFESAREGVEGWYPNAHYK